MKNYLSLLLLLITCLVNAQVVDLVGNVIVDNVEEDYNKSGIHIINQRTKELYTTTSDGSFKMKVQLNDELLFKSDFTQNRTIKITSSILRKGFINVHLDLEVIELAEANLSPLKRILKDNVWTSDTSKDQLYKSLGLDPNLQYMKIDPTYTSQVRGGYGPISGLIGVINGSKKKAKRTHAMMEILSEKDKIKSYFEENFFLEFLKIPEHKISEFISYCYVNFDLKKLVVNGRYVEIEEILKDNASAYLELINIKEK